MAKDGVESHSKILHIPMHRRRVYFLRCAPARPRLTSRTVCRRCERSVSEDRWSWGPVTEVASRQADASGPSVWRSSLPEFA